MKNSNTRTSEADIALEKDLQNELNSWFELLNKFYGYHDDELDFDVEASGEEGKRYVKLLGTLQEEAAKSIATIKSRAMSGEATATSLNELRKISRKVKGALRERDRLRLIGSRTLSEMLAYSC